MPRRNQEQPQPPWAIMRPVRGQIRFAMTLASLGAVAALGTLCTLAWAVHVLLRVPEQWPWQVLLLAAALTTLAFGLRLTAFNQSHYAAFRLETLLIGTGMAESLLPLVIMLACRYPHQGASRLAWASARFRYLHHPE